MSREGRAGWWHAEWRVFAGYLAANLQSAMEYRSSFISQVFFMFCNDVLLLFFWWVLFRSIPNLNNWQLHDVMLLYAVGASAYAFQMIFFGASMNLAHIIAEGGLDFYLTLPRNPLWHVLITRSSTSAWGDLVFGVIVYTWATGGNWEKLLLYPFFVVTGGITSMAFAVIVGSLAFFWGHCESIAAQLNNALISFSLYPESIFTPSVRLLLYVVIPAGFVTYLPVRLVHQFNWNLYLAIIGAAITSTVLAVLLFQAGLKRYESGNLMVTRL